MKLGLNIGYSTKNVAMPLDLIKHAENAGFDSVWAAETWGADVISVITWILANTTKIKAGTCIMQLPARSPACAAMTAMSLADLSDGRFIMGLGTSGPQVVEGWHGAPNSKAVTRMKEYVTIIRKIMERKEKLTFDGKVFQLPYQGEGSVGLGKPLKSLLYPDHQVPIYSASFTPAGLRVAGEVADGFFPVWMNPDRFDIFGPHLEEGFAKTEDKNLSNFEVAPMVPVIVDDNLEGCRAFVKSFLALYIGGMGAKGKNFYNDYTIKLGYEAEAAEIQDLYLDGKKSQAEAAVPDQLVDQISLLGPKERIKEHAKKWKDAHKRDHVDTMIVTAHDTNSIEVLADIFL
jgi:F420-dependent oxidoreductase-like protein